MMERSNEIKELEEELMDGFSPDGALTALRAAAPADNVGTYALVLHLPEARDVVVGRLGTLYFAAGYYVYVGSALNNLARRIRRHLALTKKKHWHIDYLRSSADIVSVYLIRSRTRCECALAQAITRLADDNVPQFGASDCRCPSHLFYFRRNPVEQWNIRIFPDYALTKSCHNETRSVFPQENAKSITRHKFIHLL